MPEILLNETVHLLLRIIIAGLCANIVGLEFRQNGSSAYLFMLILFAVGAATFSGMQNLAMPGDGFLVSAALIVAISIVTAAVMLRVRESRTGLKLAMALWISGAVGMAAGAGLYMIAIVITLASFALLQRIKTDPVTDNHL